MNIFEKNIVNASNWT